MDQEEFEKLSPEEQEKVFHQTPFRERGDLLLHSDNPLKLVQSLSREELYLLTREMDLDERSEVLRYANLPQLFFISDIDCWKKDRLHAKSFLEWLETLLYSDEQKLLAWLVEMDYETIVSGFNQLIRVIKPEYEYPSDEVLGDKPYFTLDERYFISADENNLETIRRAIEILFENHKGRYTLLLEGVLGELEYEVEEEAFQRRSMRLAERGFPDTESANKIYRPLTKEEFEKFSLKTQDKENDKSPEPVQAPHYLSLWSKEKFFLDDVLLLFREESQEVREGLEEELAWLSNKVIACDGITFASEERVRLGIERARCFVSIGLERLSGGDLYRARQILKERWLETIFRFAMGELVSAHQQAHKIVTMYWQGQEKNLIEFLDEPYGLIFKGLFSKIPQHLDREVKDHPDPLRDFRSLEEIRRVFRTVRQIEIMHKFLQARFEWKQPLPSPSLFACLGTAFVSYTLKDHASTHALSTQSLQQFLKEGFESVKGRRILKPENKKKFLDHFFSNKEKEELRPLWALLFEKFEEELGDLDPSHPPEPRFISTLSIYQSLFPSPFGRGRG